MLGSERLHTVECEQELEIHRLLGPERAVIVEDRYTLLFGHKLRIPRSRNLVNKVYD